MGVGECWNCQRARWQSNGADTTEVQVERHDLGEHVRLAVGLLHGSHHTEGADARPVDHDLQAPASKPQRDGYFRGVWQTTIASGPCAGTVTMPTSAVATDSYRRFLDGLQAR